MSHFLVLNISSIANLAKFQKVFKMILNFNFVNCQSKTVKEKDWNILPPFSRKKKETLLPKQAHVFFSCHITSSRREISSWSFLCKSSASSLYFSHSSLVALIFFLRTSKMFEPWTLAVILRMVLTSAQESQTQKMAETNFFPWKHFSAEQICLCFGWKYF